MMRNIIKFGFVFCAVLSMFSCKDMDSTYKDLLVPGGIKYPLKPTNVVARSGDGKVEIAWDKGVDPSISKAVVYWDNFTNSKEVAISGTEPKVILMLTDLKEKDYSFTIKTFDEEGNVSVPVEVNSKSYGDVYKSTIVNGNRTIIDAYYSYPNGLYLLWNGPESGLYKTKITYETSKNAPKTIDIFANESTIACYDYKPGTPVSYESQYKPDTTCMDLFATTASTFTPDFPYEFKFDRSNWKATVSSSHPNAGGGVGPSLLDGKYYLPGNYWHSGEGDRDIWISVDMKEPIKIATLILSARKRDDWKTTRIGEFILQGSNDGNSWENIGESHNVSNTETDESPQHLHFAINAEKFYKQFKIKMTHNGGGYISLGEVDIRGFRPE